MLKSNRWFLSIVETKKASNRKTLLRLFLCLFFFLCCDFPAEFGVWLLNVTLECDPAGPDCFCWPSKLWEIPALHPSKPPLPPAVLLLLPHPSARPFLLCPLSPAESHVSCRVCADAGTRAYSLLLRRKTASCCLIARSTGLLLGGILDSLLNQQSGGSSPAGPLRPVFIWKGHFLRAASVFRVRSLTRFPEVDNYLSWLGRGEKNANHQVCGEHTPGFNAMTVNLWFVINKLKLRTAWGH